MNLWRKTKCIVLGSFLLSSFVLAEDFNIKYSSNYLMPAYVHFKNDDKNYSVKAKINVPFYKIVFSSKGTKRTEHFNMVKYKDLRNGKPYSISEIKGNKITYGRIKAGRSLEIKTLNLPVFDLFTMAYQLSYFDKLPKSFYITNGKKIYLMKNIKLNKTLRKIKNSQEVTYKFKTGDKFITVKKNINEKFPRYISYNKDGDNYELKFDGFMN